MATTGGVLERVVKEVAENRQRPLSVGVDGKLELGALELDPPRLAGSCERLLAGVGGAGGKRTVGGGPLAESRGLVGGFYFVGGGCPDEAISWALRCPVGLGTDNVLEIRPLTAMTDIPPDLLRLSAEVAPAWTASVTGGAK